MWLVPLGDIGYQTIWPIRSILKSSAKIIVNVYNHSITHSIRVIRKTNYFPLLFGCIEWSFNLPNTPQSELSPLRRLEKLDLLYSAGA